MIACMTPRCPYPAVDRGRCQIHRLSTADRGYDAAWRRLRPSILARDNRICRFCGLPGATEVDHIIPMAKGGARLDPRNLAAAHKTCNSSAGGKTRRRRW